MGNNPIPPVPTTAIAGAALRLTMHPSEDNYLAWFKEQYVAGRIGLEEFEKRVTLALQGFYHGLSA